MLGRVGARAPAALGSSQQCWWGGTRSAEVVRVCSRTARAQRVICRASFMGNEINCVLNAGRVNAPGTGNKAEGLTGCSEAGVG